MRLAVISDVHVMGPSEKDKHNESFNRLGEGLPRMHGAWRRSLHRLRRRFWVDHPEARHQSFLHALDTVASYNPDWIVANGDYGGDTLGIGMSDASTFESVASVVTLIRHMFPNNAHFIFGDHEIGKYSTALKQGGIRLKSLQRGEELLGIRSFWTERVDGFHLVGVNSSLFVLDLFLPEALADEIPEWRRLRTEHIDQVNASFENLPADARVLLFCHDPSALSVISELPGVQRHISQIERTILGHYHAPSLLSLAKLVRLLPKLDPKYPVARITMHGVHGIKGWRKFRPIVCPATFGAGHHVPGGVLFVETNERGQIVTRSRRLRSKIASSNRIARSRGLA